MSTSGSLSSSSSYRPATSPVWSTRQPSAPSRVCRIATKSGSSSTTMTVGRSVRGAGSNMARSSCVERGTPPPIPRTRDALDMALQNRVTPLGDLIADPARGLVYGNRGCLHDAEGRIRRRWATRRWIACRLEFKGWHRSPLMQPGKFTELFFLDEATAFSAGHRPCALCRRADYNRFMELAGETRADDIDERLHAERGRTWQSTDDELPDG